MRQRDSNFQTNPGPLPRVNNIHHSKNWCQGGELNSRPTPNAFGAALRLLQLKKCKARIFLCLELSFNLSRFLNCLKTTTGQQFNYRP